MAHKVVINGFGRLGLASNPIDFQSLGFAPEVEERIIYLKMERDDIKKDVYVTCKPSDESKVVDATNAIFEGIKEVKK